MPERIYRFCLLNIHTHTTQKFANNFGCVRRKTHSSKWLCSRSLSKQKKKRENPLRAWETMSTNEWLLWLALFFFPIIFLPSPFLSPSLTPSSCISPSAALHWRNVLQHIIIEIIIIMRRCGESIWVRAQWRFAIVCRFHMMAYEIAIKSSVSCVFDATVHDYELKLRQQNREREKIHTFLIKVLVRSIQPYINYKIYPSIFLVSERSRPHLHACTAQYIEFVWPKSEKQRTKWSEKKLLLVFFCRLKIPNHQHNMYSYNIILMRE